MVSNPTQYATLPGTVVNGELISVQAKLYLGVDGIWERQT